jgi:hypothetical protein
VTLSEDDANTLTATATDAAGNTGTSGSVVYTLLQPLSTPVVSGTAQEGRTLTATAAITNNSDANVTYQWQADHGSGFANVAGATGLSYLVQEADEGARLRIVATATDADGDSSVTVATSGATTKVIDISPSVTISGTAKQGGTMTAIASTNEADSTISGYVWQALINGTWTAIAGRRPSRTRSRPCR